MSFPIVFQFRFFFFFSNLNSIYISLIDDLISFFYLSFLTMFIIIPMNPLSENCSRSFSLVVISTGFTLFETRYIVFAFHLFFNSLEFVHLEFVSSVYFSFFSSQLSSFSTGTCILRRVLNHGKFGVSIFYGLSYSWGCSLHTIILFNYSLVPSMVWSISLEQTSSGYANFTLQIFYGTEYTFSFHNWSNGGIVKKHR